MLIFCMDWNVLQGLSCGRKINAAKLTKPYFRFYFEFCEFGNVPFPEKEGGGKNKNGISKGYLLRVFPKNKACSERDARHPLSPQPRTHPVRDLKYPVHRSPDILSPYICTQCKEGPWREAWLCFRPRYLPLIVTNIGDNQLIWTKGLFHSAHVLGFQSMTEKTYCSWTQCHLHRDSLNDQKTPAKHPTFTP